MTDTPSPPAPQSAGDYLRLILARLFALPAGMIDATLKAHVDDLIAFKGEQLVTNTVMQSSLGADENTLAMLKADHDSEVEALRDFATNPTPAPLGMTSTIATAAATEQQQPGTVGATVSGGVAGSAPNPAAPAATGTATEPAPGSAVGTDGTTSGSANEINATQVAAA
jgi:hypothetical protein